MAQNDYGGWLQWMDGEGGQSTAQLGEQAGMVSLFDPAILAKYGLGSFSGLTAEQMAQMGQASGLGYQLGERGNGGQYVNLTQNGSATGDQAWLQDTPTNAMETILPLAFAVATGGALGMYDLSSLLGGSAGTAASGAGAAGGELAGLSASQVGALGAAEAGTAGTLGASYVPTAVGSMEGVGALTGLGTSASIPELATLASTLGADYGVGELAALAGTSLGSSAGAGLSSADKAALYGNEGYGAGMTGAQTSAYDSILNATGSSSLANLGSSAASGVSSIADLVGGGSNLAALIGGAVGAAQGGGTNTATQQSKLDPVMQQYLYGSGYGDTNSLLGAAQNWYKNNSTGLNSTMQQGIDLQKQTLLDPAQTQSYQAMRNAGTGLLNQGVAANPFSTGQASLSTNGLLGSTNIADLITAGKGLLPTRGRSI